MKLRLVSGLGLVAVLAGVGCSSGGDRPKAGTSYVPGSGETPTTDGTTVTTPEEPGTRSALATLPFSVGGTVTGLTGSVVLELAGEMLTVTANGAFSFTKPHAIGADYRVSVHTQPATQMCAVTKGAGVVDGTVDDVTVTCGPAFPVGGHVVGATGPVVLTNNGGAPLGVTGNAAFTFQELVPTGSPYEVKVETPPPGQACSVTNHGSGNITAAITDVMVQCYTPYVSCKAMHFAMPGAPSAVYTIAPGGTRVDVFCDMVRDGGGWTRVVNVRPDTSFQGDLTDALADVSLAYAPAKLDDATINALATLGYFRFDCGTLSAYVKNDSATWTSTRTNGLTWTLDPTRTGNFSCPASSDGHVFSSATGASDACGAAGMSYVAADTTVEGPGCYTESEGWYQLGALWVK